MRRHRASRKTDIISRWFLKPKVVAIAFFVATLCVVGICRQFIYIKTALIITDNLYWHSASDFTKAEDEQLMKLTNIRLLLPSHINSISSVLLTEATTSYLATDKQTR